MTEQPGRDDSTSVLTAVRAGRSEQLAAEIRTITGVVDWCVLHETDDEGAASFGDHGIPLAGAGTPWVLESAVLELCSALGQSTDAGRRYVGAVLEVRYRLPRTWEQVTTGDLPFWKARSVAEQTMRLPEAGASFVDRHVAAVGHRVSYLQLKRLVEEAQTRFDPVEAEKRARAAADGRHVSIFTHEVGIDGTVDLTGRLDLRDALDLDDALNQGATALGVAGCLESHDVRRALAAGDLARGHQSLPFDHAHEAHEADEQRPVVPPRSRVVLHVHLTEAALSGDTQGCVARVENTRSPIWADRVRDWCASPDVQVVIKPVIDLTDHVQVDAYEVPDRLRVRREHLDHHCVFPWCTRPARSCDLDHLTPYDHGGPTCTCNTAPLCRTHHRAKTHSRWAYDRLDETTYVWQSPSGLLFRVDHAGTDPLTTPTGPPVTPPGKT